MCTRAPLSPQPCKTQVRTGKKQTVSTIYSNLCTTKLSLYNYMYQIYVSCALSIQKLYKGVRTFNGDHDIKITLNISVIYFIHILQINVLKLVSHWDATTGD